MYIKRLPIGDVEANCYIICDEETKVGAVLDAGGFSDELLNEIKTADIKELKENIPNWSKANYALYGADGNSGIVKEVEDINKAFNIK